MKDDANSVKLREQYVAARRRRCSQLARRPPDRGRGGRQGGDGRSRPRWRRARSIASPRANPTNIYHKMTRDELQALTPNFDWARYFERRRARRRSTALNVTEPDFLKAFDQVIAATPLDRPQDLPALARRARVSAACCRSAFVDENFAFYGTTLTGAKEQRPRWKRCVDATDGDLGEALGKAFVEETFGPQAKADTLQMVQATRGGARAPTSTALAWMTDDDQEGRRSSSCTPSPTRSAIPTAGATTARCASSAATRSATRSARNAFEFRRAAGQDRQAGRQDRVGA